MGHVLLSLHVDKCLFNNNNNNNFNNNDNVVVVVVSCHRLFLPCTSLEPAVTPLLRLQASHYSTSRIMCDFPSITVFCIELIESFPGIAYRFIIIIIIIIIIITETTALPFITPA
jgi:hypothetical protein